jgi:cellulose synthase/poly-beta-1,6-N-acetylglucosamine synthase-like glycosyltransferase
MEGNNDDETEIELRIGRIIGLARFGGIIANIVEILRARSGEERNQSTNPSVGSSLSRSSLGGSPTERDMDRDGKNGISVIICCHNSVSKLPVTLAHLEAQEPPAAPWELLIMDNKSIDGSADFARRYWKSDRIPLRVVEEPRVGVRFARERGLSESRYPFLAFVDDDNWLAPDWLRTAYEIISSDESLACVGSILEPECEVPAPAWFDDFHLCPVHPPGF